MTVLPFVFTVALWGLLLWWLWPAMIDLVQDYFAMHQRGGLVASILNWFSIAALKMVVAPLIAIWALLPFLMLTALLLVGWWAMPAIGRHVGSRDYPLLEKAHGGSWWGSLWISCWCFALFVLAWIITLPVSIFPPLMLLIHLVLWGWLTYRIMVYDALSEYATAAERGIILQRARWPLLFIGAMSGAMGALPSLLWVGGVWVWVFLPLLAVIAIWLYVLVFVFSGLWFYYYCLEALRELRATDAGCIGSANSFSIR